MFFFVFFWRETDVGWKKRKNIIPQINGSYLRKFRKVTRRYSKAFAAACLIAKKETRFPTHLHFSLKNNICSNFLALCLPSTTTGAGAWKYLATRSGPSWWSRWGQIQIHFYILFAKWCVFNCRNPFPSWPTPPAAFCSCATMPPRRSHRWTSIRPREPQERSQ